MIIADELEEFKDEILNAINGSTSCSNRQRRILIDDVEEHFESYHSLIIGRECLKQKQNSLVEIVRQQKAEISVLEEKIFRANRDLTRLREEIAKLK